MSSLTRAPYDQREMLTLSLIRRLARSLPFAALGLATAAAVVIVIVTVTVTVGATTQAPPSLNDTIADATSGERFSLGRFEAEHVLSSLFVEVGAFVRGQSGQRYRGLDGDRRVLERYFTLSAEIDVLQRFAGPDTGVLADLRAQRQLFENRVERVLQRRIADSFRSAGLSRPLPLFSAQEILWPPVAVELSRMPRVLAVSPRDEIRLLRTCLLSPDLSDTQVREIEAAVEADGRFSAFVDRIGGVATYPAIVVDTRSYRATVSVAAHEWVHHYLFFFPLGASFFDNDELRTINETVADIVGDEIAALIITAFPDVDVPAPAPMDRLDSDALLNQLRQDVDALLVEGRVADAEALMGKARLELADEHDRLFRRINQAFFAFNGVYGDRPQSSSPIGPLLRELRVRSDSLSNFVAVVREVDSLEALQALAATP